MSIEPRKKKRSITSDPYAGQYPPPPPLTENDLNIEENQQMYQQQQQQQQQQPFYIVDQSSSSNQRNSFSSSKGPSFHEDARSTAHVSTAASSSHSIQDHQRGHYYENTNSSHNNMAEDGDYEDPEAVNLREYLYAERQEKLRRQELEMQQKQQLQTSYPVASGTSAIDLSDAYRHHHPPPRPEPVFYNNSNPLYSDDQMLYNNNSVSSPIMMPPLPPPAVFGHQQSSSLFTPPPLQQQQQQQQQQPPFMSPFRQPQLGPQSSNPSLMPSMMPPPPLPPPPPMMFNDKFSSVRRRDGCCCFGITLCSCLWTLILIAFLFAGVALIIVAKVIGDKCAASNDYVEANKTLCTQVLHDGFLYGGIALSGLCAIIVIWRVLKWSCGSVSRI
ncbi:hypothetical protein PS15m_007888 [Mucor circinelloides]